MSLTNTILWFLVGTGMGLLLFLAVPILMGPALPRAQAQRIADFYTKLMMRTLERVMQVRREVGAYSIVPSSFDARKDAEKVKLGGEVHHFSDDKGLMGTMHTKPFGMAIEGEGVVVDPFIASMTDYERPREESGDWLNEDGDYVNKTEIPEVPMLAELKNAAYMIPGNAGSKDAERTETLYEKSQTLFGKTLATDTMLLIMAYGVGAAVAFVALEYGTGGGGAPVNVPSLPAVIFPW
jgi:lauroyl/myristoyl acyltransferase